MKHYFLFIFLLIKPPKIFCHEGSFLGLREKLGINQIENKQKNFGLWIRKIVFLPVRNEMGIFGEEKFAILALPNFEKRATGDLPGLLHVEAIFPPNEDLGIVWDSMGSNLHFFLGPPKKENLLIDENAYTFKKCVFFSDKKKELYLINDKENIGKYEFSKFCLKTKKFVWKKPLGRINDPFSLNVAKDGIWACISCENGDVKIYDVNKEISVWEVNCPLALPFSDLLEKAGYNFPAISSFSPDGEFLLCAREGRFFLFELSSNQLILTDTITCNQKERIDSTPGVTDVFFLFGGQIIGVATNDATFYFYDFFGRFCLELFFGSDQHSLEFAISPDQKWLAAGGRNGEIFLISLLEIKKRIQESFSFKAEEPCMKAVEIEKKLLGSSIEFFRHIPKILENKESLCLFLWQWKKNYEENFWKLKNVLMAGVLPENEKMEEFLKAHGGKIEEAINFSRMENKNLLPGKPEFVSLIEKSLSCPTSTCFDDIVFLRIIQILKFCKKEKEFASFWKWIGEEQRFLRARNLYEVYEKQEDFSLKFGGGMKTIGDTKQP